MVDLDKVDDARKKNPVT